MTFQQLRNFCMMSEYESLTKASEALFITQPALSMALKNIEAEVGATLFDRRGKNIYLNQNGREFYKFASRTLAEWDAIIERLSMTIQNEKILRVCYSSNYISDYVLPDFSMRNPDISITMNDVKEELIYNFLCNEIYDVALSGLRCDNGSSKFVTSSTFFRNQLFVSVPINNKLSKQSSISLKELDGQKFIRLSKQGEFTEAVNAQAKKEGVSMAVMQKVNYEVIKALQDNYDFLYFITSLQAVFDYIPMNRKLVPVEGEMFKKNMYISYMKKNEAKVERLISWTQERLSKYNEILR